MKDCSVIDCSSGPSSILLFLVEITDYYVFDGVPGRLILTFDSLVLKVDVSRALTFNLHEKLCGAVPRNYVYKVWCVWIETLIFFILVR